MHNQKQIKFVFFEESWNQDNGKDKKEPTGSSRGREVHDGGVESVSPSQNDAKESW